MEDLQHRKGWELRGDRCYAASGRFFLIHCVELANNSGGPAGSEGSADTIRIRKLESTYCTVRAKSSIAGHGSAMVLYHIK